MAQKSWQLNRRELLRGGGIGLALPFLNGMSWAGAADGTEVKTLPKRMVVCYIAYGVYEPKGENGAHHDWSWWPCKNPGPLSFNKSAAPFEPLKDYVSYLRGLDHAGGYGLGGHSSYDVFATGADMMNSEKTNNISIDQFAAKMNGHLTRYPSMVLGTEGGTGSYGMCKTLSHYGPGRPIPSMHKPQDIFNRLFKPYAGKSVDDVRGELKRDASVLDLILDDSKSLNSRLGREDQGKMEEYLESIRALEQRVERTRKWTYSPLPEIDTEGLTFDPDSKNPVEYTRCLYDLIFLAFQTDLTRYATYMLESEFSSTTDVGKYPSYLSMFAGHTHDIAHSRPKESGLWDNWRAQQHAYFLQRLRDTKEGDGNMLDRTVVLWGSAHPHASHDTRNYPIHLAGGNALGFKHGKLHAFEGPKKVPLSNLFVSMLNAVDVPTKSFADSTGEISELRG